MPRPLKPGRKLSNKCRAQAPLMMFVVLPAVPRPLTTKSSAVTLAGFLHEYPAGPSGAVQSATQKSRTENQPGYCYTKLFGPLLSIQVELCLSEKVIQTSLCLKTFSHLPTQSPSVDDGEKTMNLE
ncbi:hypothetical protein VNO77_05434 [Canavalia gladiata]|uniref:Uncharacterized protein n=1 Tax=Canavalia gladiata TaxID=3824 RepID=A0AAN9N3H7_CANGL